ncbi:hypothetical protein HYDPIDRAFT_67572, partial [Hydnomerulius pinastri MD-312]
LGVLTYLQVEYIYFPDGRLFDLLSVEVATRVVNHMSVADMTAYGGTSRRNFKIMNGLLTERLHETLKPFENSVGGLFNIMWTHCAVISGSVALSFFNPTRVSDPTDLDLAITSVVTLSNSDHTIDVIESSSTVSIAPIFKFHLTAVMNFISSEGFFSAYPHLTTSGRALTNPQQYT